MREDIGDDEFLDEDDEISIAWRRLEEIKIEINGFLTECPDTCPCQSTTADTLEIRIRKIAKGNHYVRQCRQCGRQRGGALKPAEALKELGGNAPKEFDYLIEARLRSESENRSKRYTALREEKNRLELFLHETTDFQPSFLAMDSIEKAEIKRAGEALSKLVEEVIDRFGAEKTLPMLAAEMQRHKKARRAARESTVNRFTSEPELKRWLEEHLGADFDIWKERKGKHLAENVGVQLDYVFKAKKHLLDLGFDPAHFGVEVKYIPQDRGFMHKASRGIWQTISYNDCEFQIGDVSAKPKFCMIFSNLAFAAERELLHDLGFSLNTGENYENDKAAYSAMLHLANHARVGSLEIKGDRDNFCGWEFRFVGGIYFSCRRTPEGPDYSKSNENVINKSRIGNF